MRKHIYCESKFLETCISKINNWKFSPDNIEEFQLWICIKTMIFSRNIILHLDITDDDLPKFDGVRPSKQFADWQKEIAAKRNTSEIHLRLGNFVTLQSIDKSDDTQLTAYYLTCCDSTTCRNCMNECGVLAICPDNINDFKDILYDNGTAIKKNEPTEWGKILRSYPCNSLILIDNYALSDQNIIERNFLQILNTILPQSWGDEIPFQISVYTSLREDRGKDFFDSIVKMIDQLRENFYFRFSLYKCGLNDFHDRVILTNNCLIVCGGGFDLIRRNNISSKNTIINVVIPFFYQSAKWSAKAYSNFIEDVVFVSNGISKFDSNREPRFQNKFYIGDNNNRLITQC